MQIQGRTKKPFGEITDGSLAQQILDGNEEAFETLVERYSSSLFNFICRFLNNADDASDILQHVFTQLYLSLPTLHTEAPLKPWLFRVAHNRCLDELRKKRGIPFSTLVIDCGDEELSPLETIPDTNPLPEEVAEHHDLQRVLQGAIATLPPKFRVVVLLRYTSQFSFSEIANALQIPEATAKTYFQRAKPLLRIALKDLHSALAVN